MRSIKNQIFTGKPASEICPSPHYRVYINGNEVFVYHFDVASYALLSAEGTVSVRVETLFSFENVKVRPLSAGIQPNISGSVLEFCLNAPSKLSIEFDNDIRRPLFLLVNPLEKDRPDKNIPGVHYFEGGKTYDVGVLELKENETVYIEEGAVVYGSLYSLDVNNISIRGRGILDGSRWSRKSSEGRKQMIKLVRGENINIEGITLVDGPNWHTVPIACKNVNINDLNVLTQEGTGDGIDIVGCEDVVITNCFVRSNDDCVALKAVDYMHTAGCKDVKNVHVSKSVFWNAAWGNALEVGYETRCVEISNITFVDCDVIRCEFEGYQSGGTFTIHNGDRAVVSNVTYENIRIEDSQEKLIDIKILSSKYSRDVQRGHVKNIHFRNIQIVDGILPVSIIRGFEPDKASGGDADVHMIQDVTIDGLYYLGEKILSANEAKMIVELSTGIKFI